MVVRLVIRNKKLRLRVLIKMEIAWELKNMIQSLIEKSNWYLYLYYEHMIREIYEHKVYDRDAVSVSYLVSGTRHDTGIQNK